MMFFILLPKFKLTNLPLSSFFFNGYSKLVCVNKLADHPYFTRSKCPTNSFRNQGSQNGKASMSDNNEKINLSDVVVAQHVITDQDETNHIVNTTNCRDEG